MPYPLDHVKPMHLTHELRLLRALGLSLVVFAAACGDDDVTPPATDAGPADSGPADLGAAPLCEAATVPCVDQSIGLLDLFDTVSPAALSEEGTTAGEFTTLVDASGGGFMPTQSFLYARFTDTGLAKVEVSDSDAFTSMDWDISFRRYVFRVNSGVSGPSCVQAGRTAPATTFDTLTTVPAALTYHAESYLTDTCEIVPDGAGLGSPATTLSSFWSYPGCVSMTGNVYVVALRDGRHVKLQVIGYYTPENQAMCDTMGTTGTPSGAGSVRVRWSFLD